MSLWPIHLDLGKYGESAFVLFPDESFNFFRRTRLLLSELIAWKCKYLEPFRAILLMKCLVLFVVVVGESSL